MMIKVKTSFAIISLVFGFATYVPYFRNMLAGTAKPHIFSWATWAIVSGLGFVLSWTGNGGGGAWIFGLQSFFSFVVTVYALTRHEKNITGADKAAFAGALAISIFYATTKNAWLSVIFAVMIDLLAYLPTFRKSFSKPFDEPALTYSFSFFSFLFSFGALGSYTFVTAFYPLTLLVTNFTFVSFLLIRRRSLSSSV